MCILDKIEPPNPENSPYMPKYKSNSDNVYKPIGTHLFGPREHNMPKICLASVSQVLAASDLSSKINQITFLNRTQLVLM